MSVYSVPPHPSNHASLCRHPAIGGPCNRPLFEGKCPVHGENIGPGPVTDND